MPDQPREPEFPFEPTAARAPGAPPAARSAHRLRVLLDHVLNCIQLEWSQAPAPAVEAQVRIRCTGLNELTWELRRGGQDPAEPVTSLHHRSSIRARLNRLRRMFPVADTAVTFGDRRRLDDGREVFHDLPSAVVSPWWLLEAHILQMAQDLRAAFSPLGRLVQEAAARRRQDDEDFLREVPEALRGLAETFLEKGNRRAARQADRRKDELVRLARMRAQREAERRRRDQARETREFYRRLRRQAASGPDAAAPVPAAAPRPERPPLPPVPLRVELPRIELQETLLPVTDLRGYFLRERAARWWVSNQSDDLLGLPYCRIQRLEYQLRTALRVVGPLRGRALLSDEVGLGKTIEAGLVLKEYLTRGMVRRFLILTVPSLVDQWEEELAEKFCLQVATTNQVVFRADPAAFWREQPGIIASLHTLKQPAHLAVAQGRTWDLLVVDEAHYLRNRTSQAWQAVNALPRQFLLLLTATPVQNSLDDLYNLITLLQPGLLASPKEFQARFVDRKRPHRPREPEELRRLLSQVMVRNTRANAGVQLPPRRAETVLFEPAPAERAFWQQWETDFRAQLAALPPSQASLWGRLLLQAAGSSPAAWRGALESFPEARVARAWAQAAPLASSWARKGELLLPLTRGEGGVVVFTQYRHTQAALAERLQAAQVPTFVIHGQTPSPERQPITEAFRKQGGALVLTHSGTEGRNLQFCHRLVNFDLPWNPMEIEQRIGRLHRLGQQHPVRIYNLVQAGTLQEHLLELLQDKLNLFELVVGETGLILGDRFSSEDFAEEILRRWRDNEGRVAEAMQELGHELAAARQTYDEVKQLDETLFAHDYESL
jgi:superfamily II DNA or RNA helicase